MPEYSCDVNTLATNSNCYGDLCLSEGEREAIDIYVRLQRLAVAGVATYNDTDKVLTEAGKWMSISPIQRSAMELYMNIQNLLASDAGQNTDTAYLKAQSAQYLALGAETRRNILTFLKCALNSEGIPE